MDQIQKKPFIGLQNYTLGAFADCIVLYVHVVIWKMCF